ncbi:MAG: hypothetical protein PHS93_07900 [Candidatus Omnitrophica bacterium]|nr:hypothetical protein [Candidatus Omnitrophota bacterium]
MEREELEKMIDGKVKPIMDKIEDVVKTISCLPAFFEKLKHYEDVEKKVDDHHYLLCGINGKDGLVKEVSELKERGKNNFNVFFKIVSLASLIIGIVIAIKQFIS